MASLKPPTQKRQDVERAVLGATEELLGEGLSFADLGIERIAKRAGIGRTAFYFYFRDKRELLMALTAEVSELLYAEADTWYSGDAELADALKRVSALYRGHGAVIRAVVEVSTYDAEVAELWRALVGRFVDATRDRIEREQAAGRARGIDPHATAFALVWMTERANYQSLVQPEVVGRADLDDALAAIWQRAVSA